MAPETNLAGKKRKSVNNAPYERMLKASRGLNVLSEVSEQHASVNPSQQQTQHTSPALQWYEDRQVSEMQPSLHHSQGPEPQQLLFLNPQPLRTRVASVCCDICNVNCITPHNLKLHMGGKRHKAKIGDHSSKGEGNAKRDGLSLGVPQDTTGLAWCSLCSVNCKNPGNLKKHLNGKTHRAKLDGPSLGVQSPILVSPQKDTTALSWCSLCNVNCKNPGNLQKHLNGKAHKANSPLKDTLAWCSLCNVNCKNPGNLKRHLQGKPHKAKWGDDSPQIVHKVRSDESRTLDSRTVDKQPVAAVFGTGPVWCTLCKLNCMNPENLRRHLLGKKHKAKWDEQPLKAIDPEGPASPEIQIAATSITSLYRVNARDAMSC